MGSHCFSEPRHAASSASLAPAAPRRFSFLRRRRGRMIRGMKFSLSSLDTLNVSLRLSKLLETGWSRRRPGCCCCCWMACLGRRQKFKFCFLGGNLG